LAVVNEEFVRRYVPSKDPIGLQVIFNEEETPRTIIGLVKSTYEYLTQQTLRPMIYTHFLEQYSKPPWPGYAPPSQSMVLIAKHDGNTAELAGAARRILQQLDPDQVINKTATLDEMLSEDYRQQQSVLILIGTSSVLALVLAFIGIYGVVSYHVTRRIQEIGIRRALGAGSGKIIRLILGQSTLSSFVGLLIGLAAAFALTRYIASMLYGVTPRDPVVFISISVVAITVSIIAGYIPSRRATRIELSTALRDE
jgi:putative ABC transport system permease protein